MSHGMLIAPHKTRGTEHRAPGTLVSPLGVNFPLCVLAHMGAAQGVERA
jgi:hypothetical protein